MNKDTIEKREIPEKLEEMRPHPIDEEYTSPSSGGCWICRTGNGWEETDEFAFSIEFDTFYHPECVEKFNVDSLLEFEKLMSEYEEGENGNE